MPQQSFPDPPDVSPQIDIPAPPDVGELDIPMPPDVGDAQPSKLLSFGEQSPKVVNFGGSAPQSFSPEPPPSYGGMQISTQPALKKPFDLKQAEWDDFVKKQRVIGEKALADAPQGARHFGNFNAGLSALGAPAENQIELYDMRQQLARGEITLGDFLSRAGRTALAALPGVPAPEVDDKYRLAAFRAGLANEKLRDDSFVDRVTQDLSGGAGFLAKFAGVKGIADAGAQVIAKNVASPGIKLLLGGAGAAKTPIEVIASGMVPSAGSMGLLAAEPALEEGRYRDAVVDFTKGVGTDVMFRGASLAGGGAVNQLNKATGSRLSESLLAKLRPGAAGVAQGVAQTALNLDDPNLPEQAASNILTNVVLGYAPGLRNAIPGMKAMLEQQRQRPMDPFADATDIPTEARTTDIPLQGDPSFEMMTRGKRAFHFQPKEGGKIQLTPAERALQNSGTLDVVDAKSVETANGTVRYKDAAEAQKVFLQPNARDVVVFKRGEDGFYTSEVDLDASIQKATAAGKEGVFLQYGEGNEQKASPFDPNARAVTLYDRFGREVTTILAANPTTAVEALKKHHGGDPRTGAQIIERPMSEIPNIVAERAKAKVIDAQQKAEKPKAQEEIPEPPDVVDTTGLTPEKIERQSTDKGALYNVKSTFSYLKDVPEAGPVYKSLLTRHSAYNHARQMGAYTAAEINRKVNNPKLISLAMKYLYDAQAEGMVAQGRPVPNHMFLNHQERAEVAANKAKVMEIVDQLRTMNAQNATLSKTAGVQSTRPLPGDSTYVHMTPIDMTMTETNGKVKFSEQLDRLVALQKRTGAKLILADPEVMGAIERGAPRVGSKEHAILVGRGLLRAPSATKAGAARYATGESEAYSLDPKDIAERTIFDLASAASQNELVSSVRDLELQPDAQGNYPKRVMFGGKVVNTARVEIGTKPSWMGDAGDTTSERWAVVPEPIKMAIEESRGKAVKSTDDHAVKRIMSQIIKADTGVTLADTPSTTIQFLGALSSMPGVAGTGKLGKFIESIGGPPRMMASIVKALDTTGPDYADKVNHLSRHGALDTRSFGESDLPFGEKPGFADRMIDFIPGAATFQEATFGVDGIVNRVKVALYDLARDSGMTDAQALNFVIEKTGTTVDALKPELVRMLTGQSTLGIPLDAYANRNVQVLKTAAQALGFNPAGFQKRILAGTLSGLVLWTALANWFATDDDEKRGDTMGRTLGLPRDFRLGYVNVSGEQRPFFKNTDPALERAMRTFGLSAPVERYIAGDRDFNVMESALKQAWTTNFQRFSPGPHLLQAILPTFDRFGNANPLPSLADTAASGIPGADAIIKARRKEDEMALSRGEEGSPLRRLIRGMTGVFVGGNDIVEKKDIQVGNKLHRMNDQEREDAIMEIVSTVKRAMPKRPDGTIIFRKEGDALRMVNELIKDMPEGPEKNLFRRDALQATRGSGVKDIRINNEIRRNGK